MINHNRAICVISSTRKPVWAIENTIWKDGFIETRRTLKGLKKRWLQRYFLQKFFFFLFAILSFIKMEYLADQRK